MKPSKVPGPGPELYEAGLIQVIGDHPGEVRRRPSMFVGDVGHRGMLHLVYEVIANAVDLFLQGRCTRIDVTVLGDGSVRVTDDGPGIPVTASDGSPALVLALTERHDASTKDGHPIHVHLAASGLGLFVVHALSDRIEVVTAWEGRRWRVSGGAGELEGPPRDDGPASTTGTTVMFRPDPQIFPQVTLDAVPLMLRLREVAVLCPRLTLRFADERVLEFHEEEGLVGLLGVPSPQFERPCCHVAPWRPATPLTARAVGDGMSAEVRLQWALDGEPRVRSFVNLAETRGGGAHVAGLRRGLSALARALAMDEPDQVGDVLKDYVVAVVSVFHFKPTFAGPARDRLKNPEIVPLVAEAVEACLQEFAVSRPEEARALIEWVLTDAGQRR